jgi:hypothetical protein
MQAIQRFLGFVGIKLIRLWVRMFGRTVQKDEVPWLLGPIGPEGSIGERPYEMVAEQEGLTIHNDSEGALVSDFSILQGSNFDVDKIDPNVRDFYEKTAMYDLDVWSETRFPGRLFLWVLVSTVSRYMNQLNFPIFGLEMSKGMTSEVLSLRDSNNKTIHTGWLRRLKESNRVIYTGFYTSIQPPGHSAHCVKVVFPLPKGNATVILKPTQDSEGRFQLISSGSKFGDPGFYRVVELDEKRLKVLHMKSLREQFTVYTDKEGVLRCNHRVEFLKMTMLRLHYRMHLKK